MTKTTTYDIYTAQTVLRSQPLHMVEATIEIDAADIEWAIEQSGWAGDYIGVAPVVVVEHGDDLPTAARSFLSQLGPS